MHAPTGSESDPVSVFHALLTDEGQALLEELRSYDPGRELAVATRLRRDHPEIGWHSLAQWAGTQDWDLDALPA